MFFLRCLLGPVIDPVMIQILSSFTRPFKRIRNLVWIQCTFLHGLIPGLKRYSYPFFP